MSKKQTCLVPVYEVPKYGKRGLIKRYDFNFPEILTDDLGFEMHFGFPEPKDIPNNSIGEEYPRPAGLRTFYINSY
jgi:hypothetical protein